MDGEDGKCTIPEDTNLLDDDVEMHRTASFISGKVSVTSTVTFHKINYVVPVKIDGKKKQKTILKECSGIMRPGLNAILGPTGSGKTSLLDILAGRKDKRYLRGNVLINDDLQPDDFRLISGYVVQDDVLWGTLTVRENLQFSAALRLPRTYMKDDRNNRVDAIIEDLGLRLCSETKVGTNEYRGISGGERKRTCIGMELITNPDVLFLDEPTTGLDSTTAETVMKLLQRQAKRDRTIIFSIHQPRYSIFKIFDHITLLSQGQLIYAGLRSNSLEYFEKLGYECETYNNPADYFLDIITKEEKKLKGAHDRMVERLEANVEPVVVNHHRMLPFNIARWCLKENGLCPSNRRKRMSIGSLDEAHQNLACSDSSGSYGGCIEGGTLKQNQYTDEGKVINFDKSEVTQSTLREHYKISGIFKEVIGEAGAVVSKLQGPQNQTAIKNGQRKKLKYQSSFFRQFGELCKRQLLNLIRDPRGIFSQLAVTVIMAVIVGGIFFSLNLGVAGRYNRLGVLFFLTTNMIFGNMNAVSLFLQQRAIFKHETASGYYRTSTFFLSKVICDILPMRVIPTIAMCFITYYMVGLRNEIQKFLIFMLTLILTNLSAASLCMFVSSSVSQHAVANILITLPFIFMMLFSGFLIRFSDIPGWLHWLKYFSIFKYALANLQINELDGLTFHGCGPPAVNGTYYNGACGSGDDYLRTHGVEIDGLWVNMMALCSITFGFLFLSYIQLRRIKVTT